jgi:hypothetical protein
MVTQGSPVVNQSQKKAKSQRKVNAKSFIKVKA